MNGERPSFEHLLASLPHLTGIERLECLIKITDLRFRAKPSEARDYALEGLALSREMGERGLESRFLNRMGITYHLQGKFDEAVDYYNQSLTIAQELDKLEEVATNMSNIAAIKTMQGEYAEALDMQHEIRDAFIKLGDKPRLAFCYNNTGNIYLKLSAFDQCVENYLMSLRIREEIDDKLGMISSLGNIGSYLKEDDPERALEYLQRAVKLLDETGEKRFRGFIYSQLGITKFLAGRNDGCIEDLEESIKIMLETENSYDLTISYDYLAEIYLRDGDLEKAWEYRNIALKKARDNNLVDYIARELRSLARMKIDEGDIEEAQKMHDEALEISEKIGRKKYIMQCVGLQAEIYEKMEDFEKACEKYKLYNQMKEETATEALDKRAKELEVIYSIERKKREAELERQKNEALAKINADLRKVNIALVSAQNDLRDSERKVTALAMAVTANHQINQPLMVARGSAELLMMSIDEPTPKQVEHFNKIEDSISHIKVLLDKYCTIDNIDFEDYVQDTPMVTVT